MGIEDGGAAFPHDTDAMFRVSGLTKREWFAGQVLSCIPLRDWSEVRGDGDKIKAWAACAFAVADAMIAESSKP